MCATTTTATAAATAAAAAATATATYKEVFIKKQKKTTKLPLFTKYT